MPPLRESYTSSFSGTFSSEFQQHLVWLDALGLGLEVHDDAVPQGRQADAADVLEADVVAAVQQGADLGGQDQRLRRPRAGAPADVLIGDRQGELALGCVASTRRTM